MYVDKAIPGIKQYIEEEVNLNHDKFKHTDDETDSNLKILMLKMMFIVFIARRTLTPE